MLFNSFAFAVFLPVVFTLYWTIQDRYRWIVVVLSGLFFYMCNGPEYGIIIIGITVVSYFAARYIENSEDAHKKKAVLVCSILFSLLILFFFKYFNFFSTAFNDICSLLGIQKDPVIINIVLPVGISFYTFQTIGYVVDVYKGRIKAEKHFGRYAAFVFFFPQLLAGPIARAENLLPQINKNHSFKYDRAVDGAKLMLWGYYKKILIADFLTTYVQTVFNHPQEFKGFSLVIASVFFTIQIYCDFSGYSDIAIGTAKLFGIDLITNFRCPYFAKSIREFWSRWHISLSTWFRDYVYIPLGGNRVGKARHCFNLLVTFLVSGLWHGANWTFIFWGGIHGIAQIGETLIIGRRPESKHLIIRILQTAAVFIFCTIAWVFFVSNSVSDAFYVISNCLHGITEPLKYIKKGFADIDFGNNKIALISVLVLILSGYDYCSLKTVRSSKLFQWVFYLGIGCLVLFLSDKGVASEFIYFQF